MRAVEARRGEWRSRCTLRASKPDRIGTGDDHDADIVHVGIGYKL